MTSYYSVFDKVSLQFGPIMELPNDDSAIRTFKHSFEGSNQPLDWASDFDLYKLGSHFSYSPEDSEFFSENNKVAGTPFEKAVSGSFIFYPTPHIIYKGKILSSKDDSNIKKE